MRQAGGPSQVYAFLHPQGTNAPCGGSSGLIIGYNSLCGGSSVLNYIWAKNAYGSVFGSLIIG